MTYASPLAPNSISISPISSNDRPALLSKEEKEADEKAEEDDFYTFGGIPSGGGYLPESDVGVEAADKTPIELGMIPVPEPDGQAECRKPRVSRRPISPTQADLDEHLPLHLNYRSWCKHCIAGKARHAQHATAEAGKERLGVTWNADYAFMTTEEAEEGMLPTLVMYDDDKQSFWAIGVAQKGVTDPIVKYCVGVIDQSGYQGERLTFKTDQEPSIVALKRAVSVARMGETVPIESPVRASKSNGMMEGAVKVWQDQLNTEAFH